MPDRKRWRGSLIALALILALGAGVGAAEDREERALAREAAALHRQAQTPAGGARGVEPLAAELGLSPQALREERQKTGLGWGELFIAHRLAQATGLSVERIVDEFRSGKGWGAIAKAHGLNLGRLVSEVKAAHEAIEAKARPDAKGASRGHPPEIRGSGAKSEGAARGGRSPGR